MIKSFITLMPDLIALSSGAACFVFNKVYGLITIKRGKNEKNNLHARITWFGCN